MGVKNKIDDSSSAKVENKASINISLNLEEETSLFYSVKQSLVH